MLDTRLKGQLQAYLERVVHPIEINAYVDDSAAAKEMLDLLNDVVGMTDKITLNISRDDKERKPSFGINRVGANMGVRFAGLPMGHEFTSLILALLQTGGHPPKVEAEVIEQIRNLSAAETAGGLHFETFVSLSCQTCPEVVQALNLMSVINPTISHTMIDGALFQDEVNERQILSVPSVFLNGAQFGQGRMTVEEILAKLDKGSAAREAEKL